MIVFLEKEWKMLLFICNLWRNGLCKDNLCPFPNYPKFCINKILRRLSTKLGLWHPSTTEPKSGGVLTEALGGQEATDESNLLQNKLTFD